MSKVDPLNVLDQHKKDAAQAAIELGYGYDTVHRIMACKTVNEITRIMTTERERRWVW